MNKLTITIISLLLLVGCMVPPSNATYTGFSTPNPQATMQAADNMAQYAVNEATAQAASFQRQFAQATYEAGQATTAAGAVATGTAAAIQQAQSATAESISVRVTEQAIAINSTYAAISANATGTAVSRIAQSEQVLIQDEQTRLALQRDAERETIRYQKNMNTVKPILFGALGLAVFFVGLAIAYRIYERSQPVTVNDGGVSRVLIPSNSYQILPQPTRQLALPEPEPEIDQNPVLLPPLTQGHVLIAGETGSGKTTAMLAVLNRRQNVTVLDPHDDTQTWGGNVQVIGRGRDFDAIGNFMTYMQELLSERYSQRASGVNNFSPLTVATDEMPAIVSALGTGIDQTWREWLREGRKVGLFFVVSTQSTRVKTLGIRGEGDLLENFAYALILGKLAANDYPDLVSGLERPAVIKTAHGARPVIIPHTPTIPGNSNGNGITISRTGPMFTAPKPKGLNTQWGMVTPEQVSKILQLKAAGLPNSQIEMDVFQQENPGGAAYHKVKAVLDSTKNGVLVS